MKLKKSGLRHALLEHPFFADAATGDVCKQGVEILLGQWWHALNYFPTFLAKVIASAPCREIQTAIADILNEELGEGNPERAHAAIYLQTMEKAGFSYGAITTAPPLESTEKLVRGYENAGGDYLRGLGFLYGTETADLAMVSGIGEAVRRASGVNDLSWVDIHVEQEPGHVENASATVEAWFTPADEREIIKGAEEMWSLWIQFFSRLRSSITSYSVQQI